MRTLIFLLFLCIRITSLNSQTVYTLDNIPIAAVEDLERWNWVQSELNGAEGYTPKKQFINYFAAKKIGGLNWHPVDGFKHILKGKLDKIQLHLGSEILFHHHERDFNLYVSPAENFKYLINYNLLRFDDRSQWHLGVNGNYQMEAEITSNYNFTNENPFFRFNDPNIWYYDNILYSIGVNPFSHSAFDGKSEIKSDVIFFYGPWVTEEGHDDALKSILQN